MPQLSNTGFILSLVVTVVSMVGFLLATNKGTPKSVMFWGIVFNIGAYSYAMFYLIPTFFRA